MATEDSWLDPNLPPDISAELERLRRRQKVVDLLGQQAMQNPGPTQAGRFIVPAGWAQGLSGLAQALIASRSSGKLAEEQQNLAGRYRKQMMSPEGNLEQNLTGPEGATSGPVPVSPALPTGEPMPTGQAVPAAMPAAPAPTAIPVPRPEKTVEQKREEIMKAMYHWNPNVRAVAKFRLEALEAGERARLEREQKKEQFTQEIGLKTETQREQVAETKRKNLELERAKAEHEETLRTIAGVGKIPPGYRHTKEGNLEPIPGGPADAKLQGALNADTAAFNGTNQALDLLERKTTALLKHPGLTGITGVRGKIPNFPGSAAADAEAGLNTLKSEVSLGVLQMLRSNSKTGGALGNVSDAEGKRLENYLGALDKAQSTESMKGALQDIVNYVHESKDLLADAYNRKHGEGTIGAPRPTAKPMQKVAPSKAPKRLRFDAQGNPVP